MQQKIKKITSFAIKHYKNKRIKDARKQVSALLSSGWTDGYIYFQAGISAYNAGDVETSVKLYEKAIDLTPKPNKQNSTLFMALGSAYSSLGDIDQAIQFFDISIKLDPENASSFNNRGLTYLKQGHNEQAHEDLKTAHSLTPNDIGILLNLGDVLISKKKQKEALELYKINIILHPENPELHIKLGNLLKNDTALEAFKHYRKAVYLDPKNEKYLQAYSKIFPTLPHFSNVDDLGNDLLLLLSSKAVQWNYLNRIVRQYIRSRPAFNKHLPALIQSVQANQDLQVDLGEAIKALSDKVLLAALKNMRIVDPEIEKMLEHFRRLTLTAIVSGTKLEKPLCDLLRTFLIPLAHYSFFTEFLFQENEFENRAVNSLIEYFEVGAKGSQDEILLRYLILSCYRHCHKYAFAKELTKQSIFKSQTDLTELVRVQITGPGIEIATHKKIKQITKIDDAISLSVREQYEENPYPRWQNLPPTGTSSYAIDLANNLPILQGQQPRFPKTPQVLIAGCGTGRQPISSAKAYPEANILAIDLSLASISYAVRKAKETKIKSIEFGQADIMELDALNHKFHIIECSGVLHHMNDPEAGWKVLCNLLEDDGYMNIGLYSELGRQDVVACREFIQKNEFGDNTDEIRNCRKSLMALKKDHPAKRIINHHDFYTLSACRDLIFHVQEHRFTVQRVKSALDNLGLEFLGFNLDAEMYVSKYENRFPEDTTRTNLNNWAIFEEENPNVFATMYKFWVRKRKIK
ncbi:MAG: tetratricopeptide repeat protein [Sneathiella sp.]|nr:tetratricopeptide repeat protein [Sneathiella sp.]